MRDIFKKATTGAMIAGAALLVAACGGDTEANNATDLGNVEDMNTGMEDLNMVDMNTTVDMNGTTTDMNTTTTTDMNTTTTTETTNTGQ